MSAINEALKRARQTRQMSDEKNIPAHPEVVVSRARTVRSYLSPWTVALLAVLVALAALYYRELRLRQRTQWKLQQALLKLNDARGQAMDLGKQTTEFEAQLDRLREQRSQAEFDKQALIQKKMVLEHDNLAKEKKISEQSRRLHELEMDKLQLLDDNKILKDRLAQASAPAPSAQ